MIEPFAPPWWMPRMVSSNCSVPAFSPPEKMTMRRPLKQACTTFWTRLAIVEMSIFCSS